MKLSILVPSVAERRNIKNVIMINPITPKQKNERFDGPLFDEAVSFINEAITVRKWHDNFADEEKYRNHYYAILLSPYCRFNDKILDKVVESFKIAGWNCFYKECYDARGPHTCFYVGREHF